MSAVEMQFNLKFSRGNFLCIFQEFMLREALVHKEVSYYHLIVHEPLFLMSFSFSYGDQCILR